MCGVPSGKCVSKSGYVLIIQAVWELLGSSSVDPVSVPFRWQKAEIGCRDSLQWFVCAQKWWPQFKLLLLTSHPRYLPRAHSCIAWHCQYTCCDAELVTYALRDPCTIRSPELFELYCTVKLTVSVYSISRAHHDVIRWCDSTKISWCRFTPGDWYDSRRNCLIRFEKSSFSGSTSREAWFPWINIHS